MAPDSGVLVLHVGTLFQDQELTQALHSGLPLRIQVRAELWRDGFFDSQRGEADWRASVIYDPLERRYRVAVGEGGTVETALDSLPGVARHLEEGFAPALRPLERGRYYYLGTAEVRTLSLDDLDDLERWLRGDVDPTSREEDGREVSNVVGRGVRRVLVRMLGLPSRRLEFTTPRFEVDPRG